jgi:hypothetical protein
MRATDPPKKPGRPRKNPTFIDEGNTLGAETPMLDHPEVEETGVATLPPAVPVTVPKGAVEKWASYNEADNNDFDQQDMAIPRVKLVQSTSPCTIKTNPGYIKGVHNGDFLFTLDNTAADGEAGFLFIPCTYRREYVEWTPQRKPAVFHGTDDSVMRLCTPNEKGAQLLQNGNEVVMSGAWYGMASQDEGKTWGPVVIGLNKSQFKVSKKLASSIQMFRETDGSGRLRAFPMFWRAFRVTSEQTSGELGAWNLWNFASEAKAIDLGGDKLLDECAAFRESVMGGTVNARHEDEVE